MELSTLTQRVTYHSHMVEDGLQLYFCGEGPRVLDLDIGAFYDQELDALVLDKIWYVRIWSEVDRYDV